MQHCARSKARAVEDRTYLYCTYSVHCTALQCLLSSPPPPAQHSRGQHPWWTSLSGTCPTLSTAPRPFPASSAWTSAWGESLPPPSPTPSEASSAGMPEPMLSGTVHVRVCVRVCVCACACVCICECVHYICVCLYQVHTCIHCTCTYGHIIRGMHVYKTRSS